MKCIKCIISLILFSTIAIPSSVFAQTEAVTGTVQAVVLPPFGGPILGVVNCTCSGNLLITIFDFRTKLTIPVIFQPGISRLNSWFNITTPSIMTLGTYAYGGQCLIYSGTSCSSVPSVGTITGFPFSGVGTSLVPPSN